MSRTLRLTSPMMHGPAVKRLQELLDQVGYDYGPNDGIYGADTEEAVKDFQKGHGLVSDGFAGDKTWKTILGLVDASGEDTTAIAPASVIHDIRGMHPKPKLYARKRKWSDIWGVVFHQTGCEMPKTPMGWKRLNAQIGITQEGLAVIANDPTDMIWHAQGLSKRTIGIEIEGNFQGVDGVDSTLWKGGGGPHNLNPKMLHALEYVLVWLIEEFAKHNATWEHIFAHRQSASSRRGDPGSEIWNKVAMQWAKKLSFDEEYDGGMYYSIGSGSAIPQLWNPNYIRKY